MSSYRLRISDCSADVCSSVLCLGRGEHLAVVVGKRSRLRHGAAAVARDHREYALNEVAIVVGEFAVQARDHRSMRKVAVVSERHLAPQEITHRIEAVAPHEIVGVDHVAERLRDLLAFVGPPAVRSEEHTSELQSLMRSSYAVFCLKKQRRLHVYNH